MIHLVCVGKVKSSYHRDGIDDYTRRLSRFSKLRVAEIPDSKPEDEGRKILTKIKGKPLVLCDLKGEAMKSEDLASFLSREASPCFVIGGPDGLSDELRSKADKMIKLSDLTLTHEFARLLLLEQLYRGYCILNGHPYHR